MPRARVLFIDLLVDRDCSGIFGCDSSLRSGGREPCRRTGAWRARAPRSVESFSCVSIMAMGGSRATAPVGTPWPRRTGNGVCKRTTQRGARGFARVQEQDRTGLHDRPALTAKAPRRPSTAGAQAEGPSCWRNGSTTSATGSRTAGRKCVAALFHAAERPISDPLLPAVTVNATRRRKVLSRSSRVSGRTCCRSRRRRLATREPVAAHQRKQGSPRSDRLSRTGTAPGVSSSVSLSLACSSSMAAMDASASLKACLSNHQRRRVQ